MSSTSTAAIQKYQTTPNSKAPLRLAKVNDDRTAAASEHATTIRMADINPESRDLDKYRPQMAKLQCHTIMNTIASATFRMVRRTDKNSWTPPGIRPTFNIVYVANITITATASSNSQITPATQLLIARTIFDCRKNPGDCRSSFHPQCVSLRDVALVTAEHPSRIAHIESDYDLWHRRGRRVTCLEQTLDQLTDEI